MMCQAAMFKIFLHDGSFYFVGLRCREAGADAATLQCNRLRQCKGPEEHFALRKGCPFKTWQSSFSIRWQEKGRSINNPTTQPNQPNRPSHQKSQRKPHCNKRIESLGDLQISGDLDERPQACADAREPICHSGTLLICHMR